MALRVLCFVVLLAVKAVLPLAQAAPDTAEEATRSAPELETEGEDDDSDVVASQLLGAAHVVEKHHPPAREARRPEEPPAAPADRPPNA